VITSFSLFDVSFDYTDKKNCQFVRFNGLSSLYVVAAILCYASARSNEDHCKLISNSTMQEPVILLLKTGSMGSKYDF